MDASLHLFPTVTTVDLSHNQISNVVHLQDCHWLSELDLSYNVMNSEAGENVMKAIRVYLADNTTCPFKFETDDQARVIAGEEEAAYAWTGVNFVTGALFDSSWGSGAATPQRSYGTLEMGGASSQIAFYKPVSILSNLFKLQVSKIFQ